MASTGLYSSRYEHDACGIGFVANIKSNKSHQIVSDALTILAAHPDAVARRSAPTVLTTHAGEFARLAGHPPGDDRVGAALELADAFGATVLLKGNVTVVACLPIKASDAPGA